MKTDQMFNTFAEGPQTSIYRRKKISQNRKSIETTNLSAIQLNPWHDQGSKSYAFLESDNFFSSPKLSFNYSPTFKQPSQKTPIKSKQKRFIKSTKKLNTIQVSRNHLFSQKQKRLREAKQQQVNLMNKTISVHNFSGDKVFNQTNSFIKNGRQSLNVDKDKQKNSRRTIISNPMYLKFCNTFVSERQRIRQRKKTLSDFDPKTIDFQSQKVVKIKEKMPIFSPQKGDINKAKNIHELRKRLKSNSELSRRNSIQKQVSRQSQNRIFQNQTLKTQTINLHHEQSPKQKQTISKKKIEKNRQKQVCEDLSDRQRFKLGQRKNLYIGYRKFFHPLYHVIGKDRKLTIQDQGQKKEIINLQSLQKVVDLQMIKNNLCN